MVPTRPRSGRPVPAPVVASQQDGREPMALRERPLISIVDDDASLRRSVSHLLSSVGFQVATFASAEAFLASAHRSRTACLVLDLQMSGMHGLELLSHLSVTGSRIPAVVLTAHGDVETRGRSLEAGAVAFLGKPFRGDALL